jgi:hypothetical protein
MGRGGGADFGEFDGGVIHIHGNGRHLLPAVSSVRGLRRSTVQRKRYPPAIVEAPRLQQRSATLIVSAEFKISSRRSSGAGSPAEPCT